jgi:hypothetical protein
MLSYKKMSVLPQAGCFTKNVPTLERWNENNNLDNINVVLQKNVCLAPQAGCFTKNVPTPEHWNVNNNLDNINVVLQN